MISILHLSDLHIAVSARWHHLKACILDEASRVKNRPRGEKLLIITGDFHNFWESNYDETERFLCELIAEMNIDVKKDVFLIPGNHDVGNNNTMNAIFPDDPNWSARQKMSVDKLADEATKPEGAEYEQYVRDRLESYIPYKNFVTKLRIYNECEEPAEVHVRCWRNKLNLLHLNTTLVADGTRKNDQRVDRLKVADDSIWEKVSPELPALALGHNHFFDLHYEDRNNIRAIFKRHGVCAYLCGDTHKKNLNIDEQNIKLEEGHNPEKAPTVPNVVGVKGAANVSDEYSDFGLFWHDWDETTGVVTLKLLNWDPMVSLTKFADPSLDKYYMPRKDCISHSKSFISSSVLRIYQEDNYSFCYKPDQLKLVGAERKKILKNIVDWANTDNEIGMSAILGAPGCGKSRLAFEVWRELEQQGWNALWIDRLLTDELVVQENLKQFSGNVLIVVDDVQFCTLIYATVLRYFLSSNSVERRGISKVRFVITAYEECEELKLYSRLLGRGNNYCSYELKMLDNSEIGELISNYINTRGVFPNLDIATVKESIIKKLEDDTIGESAPLYALFMAEAICSGQNIENWAQKDILDYVISIENNKIEKALEDMQLSAYQKPIYRSAVRTIRMIATVTGGVQCDLFTTISHLPSLSILADFNHRTQINELLRRANLIDSEDSIVLAMKPDIVGGYHALTILLDSNTISNDEFNCILRFMIKEGRENTIKYIGEVCGRFSVRIDNPIETEFIMKLRYDALFVIGSDLATWTEQRAIKNGYTTRNVAELSDDEITELINEIKLRYTPKNHSDGEIATIDEQRIRSGLKEYTTCDESSWRTESAEYLWQFYSKKDAIVEEESLSKIENGQIKDIFLVTIDPYVAAYKGPTLWGQPHGKGIVYWEDGTTCEGVFRCSPVFSRLHGEYLFKHPDGRTYTCMFSYGLRDGMGTFVWPDGAKYEGEWSAGLRDGKGIMTYPDGTTVSGEWRKDKCLNKECLPEGIEDSIYQVPLNAYPYERKNLSGSVIDNYAERIKGDD